MEQVNILPFKIESQIPKNYLERRLRSVYSNLENTVKEQDIVLLPEYIGFSNNIPVMFDENFNPMSNNSPAEFLTQVQTLARERSAFICIGTVCELEYVEDYKVFHNTSVMYGPNGIASFRRKIVGSDSCDLPDALLAQDFKRIYRYEHLAQINGKPILLPGIDTIPESPMDNSISAFVEYKALINASKTLRPFNIEINGQVYKSIILICAENTHPLIKNLLKTEEIDLVIAPYYEADIKDWKGHISQNYKNFSVQAPRYLISDGGSGINEYVEITL